MLVIYSIIVDPSNESHRHWYQDAHKSNVIDSGCPLQAITSSRLGTGSYAFHCQPGSPNIPRKEPREDPERNSTEVGRYLDHAVLKELLFCSVLISSNIESYGIRECDLTVWTPQGERSELFEVLPANMI